MTIETKLTAIAENVPKVYEAGKIAGGAIADSIVDRTITSYSNENIQKLGEYAFAECGNLISVNIPKVTEIQGYSFYYCESLVNVNAPLLTTITGPAAFEYARKLEKADFPLLKRAYQEVFLACNNLSMVNMPLLDSIPHKGFQACNKKLTSVNFPSAKTIGSYGFGICSVLKEADFLVASTIDTYAFQNCTALTKLILRASTVCTLKNVNAFTGSAIAKESGYIYVPDNLVESYKTATNWITYANQIKGISELGV